MDFFQHFDDGLVRAAVQRTPKRANACRNGGEEISTTRSHHAHRRGRAILLVVGMQQQDQIQCARDFRMNGVINVGSRKKEVQEIRAVIQTGLRIDRRFAFLGTMGERGKRADLGDEHGGRLIKLGQIMRPLVRPELRIITTERIQGGR